MQALQQEIEKLTQKNQELQGKHDIKMVEAQQQYELDSQRVANEREKMQAELFIKMQEMLASIQLEQRRFQADVRLELAKIAADKEVKKEQAKARPRPN